MRYTLISMNIKSNNIFSFMDICVVIIKRGKKDELIP